MADETPPEVTLDDGTVIRAEEYQLHEVELTLTVKLVLHPEALKGATDDGPRDCYGFGDDDDVVEHLLFNLLQGRRISQLDGWADLPAVAGFVDDLADVDILRREVTGVPEHLLGAIRYDLRNAAAAAKAVPA